MASYTAPSRYSAVARDEDELAPVKQSTQEQALVAWVLDKVNAWEDHRNTNYLEKWDEYYRLWRGIWQPKDSNRESERSKLISPALQQAIESTVAELEEAAFGKGAWFDLEDDIEEERRLEVAMVRDLLLEDFQKTKIPHEMSKVFLNGCLYGTGIAKIIVEETTEKTIMRAPDGEPYVDERPTFKVKLETIDPREFAIDPAARSVDEALGCAHIIVKPTHEIKAKQEQGIYNDYRLGAFVDDSKLKGIDGLYASHNQDKTKIIEYYGKVPQSLLPLELEEDEELVEIDFGDPDNEDTEKTSAQGYLRLAEDDDLVEAIVTIANDQVLLRATENRYLMQDRPILAYQHDIVPHKFWGRGVAEKGYNPQKALDAELRARIDALALTTHPMMAADATRLSRGMNLTVRPGKVFLTNGKPSETFMPFNFGQGINQATFHQSGDLERMIQMGTGAMDSATPTTQNPRNQTASGMSMIQSGFIKRSKRSLQNISSMFLKPFIEKAAWRYMQFNPERYPVTDVKFKTVATMGIMAREYEQGQLTQLLSVVPPETPAFNLLLKGIFDNSSLTNKAEMMQAIEETLAPNPQEQQMQQMQFEMQMKREELEQTKIMMEIMKLEADATKALVEAQTKGETTEVNRIRAELEGLRLYAETLRGDQKANDTRNS